MNRILHPSWQFLLASGLRRGVWMAAPGYFDQELTIARLFLAGGDMPSFNALGDSIDIKCVADSTSDTNGLSTVENTCAVIPITGTMFRYGTLCSYGADEYAAMMDFACNSPEISCIVLSVDSGGGDARAVPPMIEGIERLKSAGKPVIASVDTCCSAAYFFSCVCDKIFAQNTITASIGSIGTYCQIVDDSERDKSSGIIRHSVYAPASKDKNQPYLQALKGEYSLLTSAVLTPLNDSFVATIKAHRPLVPDDAMSGREYFANDAISANLIDGVKTLNEAIRFAQDLALTRKFTN